MISVSLFLHPARKDNIKLILDTYSNYVCIDEILIVTGTDVLIPKNKKTKIIRFDPPYDYGSWPCLGLASRYIWAYSCKNDYVFIQDDDMIYSEDIIKKLYNLKTSLAGIHGRWFWNNEYKWKPKFDTNKCEILTTAGLLVKRNLLPDVMKYAIDFWQNNQKVFNGEDIFLSRAIAKITGQNEFYFFNEGYTELNPYNVRLTKTINKKKSRIQITRDIYEYFKYKQ